MVPPVPLEEEGRQIGVGAIAQRGKECVFFSGWFKTGSHYVSVLASFMLIRCKI